jgi:hypothetical protein
MPSLPPPPPWLNGGGSAMTPFVWGEPAKIAANYLTQYSLGFLVAVAMVLGFIFYLQPHWEAERRAERASDRQEYLQSIKDARTDNNELMRQALQTNESLRTTFAQESQRRTEESQRHAVEVQGKDEKLERLIESHHELLQKLSEKMP